MWLYDWSFLAMCDQHFSWKVSQIGGFPRNETSVRVSLEPSCEIFRRIRKFLFTFIHSKIFFGEKFSKWEFLMGVPLPPTYFRQNCTLHYQKEFGTESDFLVPQCHTNTEFRQSFILWNSWDGTQFFFNFLTSLQTLVQEGTLLCYAIPEILAVPQ